MTILHSAAPELPVPPNLDGGISSGIASPLIKSQCGLVTT